MQNTKRTISLLLVICMLLSVLPFGALAVDISDRPENGYTEGQPFAPGTGGSQNFRIPGIVTLDDGTVIAACDARWNHSADSSGLDTIVSVSRDNGETWEYTFANYLGDNGNVFNSYSSCIIDPAIGTDGTTVYLIADLFPAGMAINTSAYRAQDGGTGYDAKGNLLLRSDEENGLTFGQSGYDAAAAAADYGYYLKDGSVYRTDGSKVEGYEVDAYFNITGTDGTDTNLFFGDSPYKPFPTDYLYLTTSTDGLNWSEPTLINLKTADEQTLLIGPGNGTCDPATGRMIFTAYKYDWGTQFACLVWMDTDGTWHRSENATVGNHWSSEASSVVLDDGTVRMFYRDGYSNLFYTDYVYDESVGNYVVSAREVSTTAAKRYNNQLTSIRYSRQVNGKDAILVACAANPDARADGHLYVFLLNEDNTMTLAYDYDIFPDAVETYAYNCITELDNGNIALLYESQGSEITYHVIDMAEVLIRDNDPSLSFVDIDLLTGSTYSHTDSSGYYGDADLSELDTSVATVELSGEETTTNAAMVLSNSATVDLDSCQYTFTASGAYYHVWAEADGATVYLNHYSSTGNNIPNVTSPAGEIAVLEGTVDGMFQLQAQITEGGSGAARTLHFHAESATPYWNRCGSDTSYKCNEYLYRKAAEGEEASTEIPGYIRLTSVDEVVDGGKYLIAARNDAGSWYVLNPASSTTTLEHMAQVMGSSTVGYTDLVFTGVGAGYTEVQIGSTVYRLTVNDITDVPLEIPVGTSVTVTEPNGNYADADTSAIDASVASVVLTGVDGTNSSGAALAPATELVDGTYLIVNTRASKVVNNSSASESAAAGSMAGLKLQGTTSSFDAATAVWTFTAVDGGYTIQDADGKYMSIARNSAGVLDEAHTIHVERNGSTWVLEENNAYLNDAAGMGTTASGWEDGSARNDAGSQFSLYAYSVTPGGPSTEVTFTGLYPGSTELLVGRTRYLITVTGDVVDVDLKVGESAEYLVDGDPELVSNPDEAVVSAEYHEAEVGHLGTDAGYTGEFVNLSDAMFTFTENEDGTYVISNGDTYLEGYASTNGYPVVDYPTNITIGEGFEPYTVTLYSTSAAAERSGYLFFWRDGKNYYDRVTSTSGFESGVSFHLYEQMDDGSFTMIAGKDDIVSGNRYLIVADAGEHGLFVTWPTTDQSTRYSQIAKFGVGTRITFTGLAAGETALVIPGYIFEITVGDSHEHSYEAVVTAPTCTEQGYTTYTCECGESYIADETAALGHDWKGTGCTRCDETRENPFTDVPEDSFYIDPVLWAVGEGITNGATATTFDPNGISLRGHVVTFLWRAAGCPEPTTAENPFTDVKETDFFYKAVLWAVEKGITNGTSATTFSPTDPCNRAQVVTFLWRAMGQPESTTTENPFSDVVVTAFYGPAVLWAVEEGITNGMGDGTFGVNATCNRAQVVTFLYRLYNES